MKRAAFLCATVLALGLGSSTCGAAGTDMDAARAIFDTATGDIDQKHTACMTGAAERYGKILEKCRQTAQGKGDLDALLVIMEEQKRCTADKQVLNEPPPSFPEVLKKAVLEYHRSILEADAERDEAVENLRLLYQSQLELLKNSSSAQDQVENITKEMERIASISSSGPEAKRFYALVPCKVCSGTRLAPQDCKKCEKTGRCGTCRGAGTKTSGLAGSRARARCPACKGSGKCPMCKGTGLAQAPCTACQGSGTTLAKASTVAPKPVPKPTAGKPQPGGAGKPAPARPMAANWAELKDYVNVMGKLKEQCRNGQFEAVDFEKVAADASQFKGRMLRSRVILVSAYPRGVKVAFSEEHAAGGGCQLIPECLATGHKAEDLLGVVGPKAQVTIIYGVVNEDNISLFDIAAQ